MIVKQLGHGGKLLACVRLWLARLALPQREIYLMTRISRHDTCSCLHRQNLKCFLAHPGWHFKLYKSKARPEYRRYIAEVPLMGVMLCIDAVADSTANQFVHFKSEVSKWAVPSPKFLLFPFCDFKSAPSFRPRFTLTIAIQLESQLAQAKFTIQVTLW